MGSMGKIPTGVKKPHQQLHGTTGHSTYSSKKLTTLYITVLDWVLDNTLGGLSWMA
jgi:hypothetical protein